MATSSSLSTVSCLAPCHSFLQHQHRHVAAPSKLGRRLLVVQNVETTDHETTTSQLNFDTLSGSISHTLNTEVIQVRHKGMVDHIRSSIVREEPLECLATIDVLQRLGIDYHFRDEIDFLLQQHSHHYLAAAQICDSLLSAALSFRLVRQHGQFVPTDVFHHFINGHKEALGDVRGLLALHEASYLGMEGEEVLDQVCSLSRQLLLETSSASSSKSKQLIMNALHHPLQRSLSRFNFNQYLQTANESEGRQGRTRILYELAKIDYNLVQSMHRRELEQISSWWAELDMGKNLAFARESPMEWFICSMAILSNPTFSKYRVVLAKSIAFIYIIDDIYDVYGTVDQLTAFSEAIKGWDSDKLKDLPQCMQTSFAALSNILNEVANMVIKEHGWNPLSALRKLWSGLCDAFLEEAKWFAYYSMPNSWEYLRNGSMSTGVPLLLAQVSIMLGSATSYNNTMDLVQSDEGDLFSSAARVFRLSDDLSSSTRRQGGHDGCYLDYYMKEREGSSLESAIDHVKNMISGEWKKMNRECLAGKFTRDVRMASLNLARLGQWLYPCDDISRHGATDEEFHSLLEDLLRL